MSENRILLVESRCHVNIEKSRLRIKRPEGDVVFVSVNDIALLALFNSSITISIAAIQKLSEQGAIILVMDEKHHPISQLVPASAPTRQTLRLAQQIALIGTEVHGALWAQIVSARIRSEARVLRVLGRPGALNLERMSHKIRHEDPQNIEAQAAKHYWRHLSERDFKREKEGADDEINSRLNFGYAVLRAMISRAIACSGLNPCLGIHHKSMENPFNLADDFIEAYRFIVEKAVFGSIDPEDQGRGLVPQIKRSLIESMLIDLPMGGRKMRLPFAIEETINSYIRILDASKRDRKTTLALSLPQYDHWN